MAKANGSVIFLAAIVAVTAALRPEPKRSSIPALPKERGGQDLVGSKWNVGFDRWVNGGKAPPQILGKVVLYRWWTDSCRYCESSLPAFESLRHKYAEQGLTVVAVYHPKPPRNVGDKSILAAAQRLGFSGPIAVDADWAVLNKLYLSTGERSATSVSFLVDASGVIRFVHPGPDLFSSDDPAHRQQNEDFALLDRAIGQLVKE